ncbi:MAG: glycosyltransferase family 4 protein [Planctomycetota bacterium]
MKVLVLSPNPYFTERGTPLAVRLLVETLVQQGHLVDILTYHEGETPAIAGARVFRIARPPFVRNVPIGFSWKKLLCDAFLLPLLAWRLARERYDLVHAVEESAYLALLARRAAGIPYVYDMDSSLASQIVETIPRAAPLFPFLHYMERRAMRAAAAIAPMCTSLAESARQLAPGTPVQVLEDVPMGEPDSGAPELRSMLGVEGPLLLYVGNLEGYQGIDLMIQAFARVVAGGLPGHLVAIGGKPEQVAGHRERVRELGLEKRLHFPGPRPVRELPGLLGQADVLLSPRLNGVNTPMKIYSYLAAGVPTVATRIESHTQVLTDDVAVLTDVSPEAFAVGIDRLLRDPPAARELGARAKRLAESSYSLPAFRRKVAALYRMLDPDHARDR